MKNTQDDQVAIFWDYENCPASANASTYAIVNNVRSMAQSFGSVKSFKAYLEVTEQIPVSRRSELQSSGVSLIDCPHNGRKEVADNMILVDMLAHAIDNPAPSTIILISGDRDFAYALSILRLRRYRVVLVTLSNAHQSLRAQASISFDWASDILEPDDRDLLPDPPTSPRRRKISSPPTHDKFESDPLAHDPSRSPFQESYDEKSASSVEPMNDFEDESSTSSVASGASYNRPESSARISHTPVGSSYRTDSLLTLTPILTPNTSVGSTPKNAIYGNIIPSRSSTHSTLTQHKASTSIDSINSIHQLGSDVSLANDIAALLASIPRPSMMSPPVTTAQSSVKPDNPRRPTSFLAVPENFRILIRCLKTHRSRGILNPLQSKVSSEIDQNGTTYRQAGVLEFGEYVAMAEKGGIVELGGAGATAWIGLKSPWYNLRLS